MTTRLRVAYFGTGHTGTQVLRQLLQRPAPELGSRLVHSPERVGKHSGAIAELGPAGRASPTSMSSAPSTPIASRTCPPSSGGKNVLVRLVYPKSLLARPARQARRILR
jgi:hypothetical protein